MDLWTGRTEIAPRPALTGTRQVPRVPQLAWESQRRGGDLAVERKRGLDALASTGRGESSHQMSLIEKVTSLISGHSPPDSAPQESDAPPSERWPNPVPPRMPAPTAELAVARFRAEHERYVVETKVAARNSEARRKSERLDQLILFALVVVLAIALLKTKPEQWPQFAPPTLIAGILLRLVWVTRRGGPPASG